MKKKTLLASCVALCILTGLVSCASQGAAAQSVPAVHSAAGIEAINANCFEVVSKKPVRDSMTYDAKLNWDLVDYRLRNDPYIGLGTAFAISSTELVTAAHVLGFDQDSLVFTERYIRQKVRNEQGKTEEIVREIDSVTSFSTNRDYVVFTVKDMKFKTWFDIAEKLTFNDTIYTAGNAYGEGIVIREGRLLDTLSEPENGEWEYLKSSIATNPGNSGGPLLNSSLQVIGIVLQKKDDFCYALNIKDILPGKAILHRRLNFGFAVFTKKLTRTWTKETALPLPYRDLVKWATTEQEKIAVEGMTALLDENKADMFPEGQNSLKALYTFNLSAFPQMFLQGSNDNAWFLTNVKTSTSDIGENGKIYWAEPYENAGIFLLDIEHPESIPAADFTDKPKIMMDHILKGIKFDRKLTQGDIGARITSMGEPVFTGTHTDRWGRRWNVNHWLMEYADQMIIIFSTPTPQGVSMLYKATSSSDRTDWMWDMKRITDFINISYMGTLEEWKTFFSRKDFLFGPLKSASFAYTAGKSVRLDTADFTMTVPDPTLAIGDKTLMTVNLNVFMKGNSPVWDIRRAIISESADANNFAFVLRMSEPDKNLPKTFHDEWKNYVVDRKHPYAGVPYVEEGNSKNGAVHRAYISGSTTVPKSGSIFFVYAGKSGNKGDDYMKTMLNTIEENLIVK